MFGVDVISVLFNILSRLCLMPCKMDAVNVCF